MNNENPRTSSVMCKNCGGKLEIDASQETVECPFCGTVFPINDVINESDSVRIEKMKQQVEINKLEHEKEQLKKQEDKENLQAFKKGKFSKVLIFFCIITAIFFANAFRTGKIAAGALGLVVFILFTASWLMGMQIIKEPKKGIRTIIAIVAFVLLIPCFNLNSSSSSHKSEKIQWADIELGEFLPEPSSNTGEIYTNSESSLSIYIEKYSSSDYKEYLSECENMGYTIDTDKTESTYTAYNSDGYKLNLYYSSSSEEMSIDLDAPMKTAEIQWPNSELGKLLPVPKSTQGNISYENSNEFNIYVSNTTISDFQEYVTACSEKGFNVDYNKYDDTYEAYDSNGNYIFLQYEGFNIMNVYVAAADTSTDSSNETGENAVVESTTQESTAATATAEITTQAPANTASTDTAASNIVSPDFKAALDSYEQFFDEYIAIVKKYSASDGTDMTLLADYASYMGKYAEMMQKLDDMENEQMNAAEAAYYLEVQTRITQKLSDAAEYLQ